MKNDNIELELRTRAQQYNLELLIHSCILGSINVISFFLNDTLKNLKCYMDEIHVSRAKEAKCFNFVSEN